MDSPCQSAAAWSTKGVPSPRARDRQLHVEPPPEGPWRRTRSARVSDERFGGARVHGGIHRAPGLQVHRLFAATITVLGRDRPCYAVGAVDRRTTRGSPPLLLPRPDRAARRPLAARRRHVAAARATCVGLSQSAGGPRSPPVRGEA